MSEKTITAVEHRITARLTRSKDQKAFPNPLTIGNFTDPWIINGSGGQICQFAQIRFTIYRSGGNTEYTLAWEYASFGWQANPNWGPPPFLSVEIKDGAGGLLDTWQIGRPDHGCDPTPEQYRKEGGNPDLLQLDALEVDIIVGGATWGRCGIHK
jgi:hypothetical protein